MSNPFEGKKITYASTERIEEFAQLSREFMEQVFDMEAGDYLISDESDLLDFTDIGSSDTSEIWKRITKIYSVSPDDVASERLVEIFAAITQRKNLQ
jgi:hypothetical protein